VSAPEPRTIVRHRSSARRYPIAVAILFMLASLPMLAAVLAGSASLDSNARPRTPFIAEAPDGRVVVPGGGPDRPSGARTPVASIPGRDDERGYPPRDEIPVRTGSTTRLDPTRTGLVGNPPAPGGGVAPRGGPGIPAPGDSTTPKPSMAPGTPGDGGTPPTSKPECTPTPTPSPSSSEPTVGAPQSAPETAPTGNSGIVGGLVGGVGSLVGLG
jgi:hypothetical protein